MLRVTIELVPYGLLTPRVIGVGIIANDGAGTSGVGNYDAGFFNANGDLCGTARLEGFARLDNDAWALLGGLLERLESV